MKEKRSEGQSFVELAMVLPVLLIILSGLMEFGLALNEFVEIQDAVREGARFASDNNPFWPGTWIDRPQFYLDTATMVTSTLGLPLDPARDDIVISVFSVDQAGPITRYPSGGQWNSPAGGVNEGSQFSVGDIQSRLNPNAPSTGIVLVELFYNYNHKLALPWITVFVPDPIVFHSYAIMPLVAAEPD